MKTSDLALILSAVLIAPLHPGISNVVASALLFAIGLIAFAKESK